MSGEFGVHPLGDQACIVPDKLTGTAAVTHCKLGLWVAIASTSKVRSLNECRWETLTLPCGTSECSLAMAAGFPQNHRSKRTRKQQALDSHPPPPRPALSGNIKDTTWHTSVEGGFKASNPLSDGKCGSTCVLLRECANLPFSPSHFVWNFSVWKL